MPALRCIYNYNLGKASYKKGKIRKKLLFEKFGQCVLHPLQLKTIKIKKGMVLDELKYIFLVPLMHLSVTTPSRIAGTCKENHTSLSVIAFISS